jgi:DNA (cytosine-5)-methyltransferase 1
MPRKKSYITLTDQFCGCGGSTLGAVRAGLTIVQAMNHWKLACETYAANHHVDPDCADVSATNPRRYASTDILITSPECTNHSLAKGKVRRFYTQDLFGNQLIDPSEERSRATMWDVPRFAEYHEYEIISVENVVDAAKWRMWDSWLHAMHSLGYEHEAVYFNSMFAWPTPQSRDRLYVVFWKKGNRKPDLEIRPKAHCMDCDRDVEAIQTWKKPLRWGRYKAQYFYRCPSCSQEVTPYYYAAFNAIDWSIKSERIGDRKKPLRPKTMERIRYGFAEYGKQVQIITGRYTSGVSSRVRNANSEPFPTQPGDSSHAVVMPWMIETYHSKVKDKYLVRDTMNPSFTQTTGQTLAIVSGFLSKQYGGGARPEHMYVGLNEPTGTITTYDHHALLHTDAFLGYYYGTLQASGIMDPVHTVTSKDRAFLVEKINSLSIEDLYFRMFRPHEVGKVMAFPSDYIVLGDSKAQVKQYGNAVTPPAMDMLMERCIESLDFQRSRTIS